MDGFGMRCDRCPVGAALACLGERVPHLCQLVAEGQPGRAEQLIALAEANRPGLVPKLLRLTRALVAHIRDWFRKAPRRVRAERAATCRACPQWIVERDSCKICGCMLSIKRGWASSRCPLEPPRWDAV
jgi:hypothetical protein